MVKIKFSNEEEISFEIVRTFVIEMLKDKEFNQFPYAIDSFKGNVEFTGGMQHKLRDKFLLIVHEILWELIIQRVITPGSDSDNINLPKFRVTDYGKKVLACGEFIPHDPTNYLQKYSQAVGTPDSVAFEYLKESLRNFNSGCYLSATMMLGIASERMFLTLCDALLRSLSSPKEEKQFRAILDRISLVAKLDFVRKKIEYLMSQKGNNFPQIQITNLVGVFEFIRVQRNDIGHPQDKLQKPERDDVYVNLRIFPQYCKTLEEIKNYLKSNKV